MRIYKRLGTFLPIRHGEGKIFTLIQRYRRAGGAGCVRRGMDAKRDPTDDFPDNPNGRHAIAGLSDPTGEFLG